MMERLHQIQQNLAHQIQSAAAEVGGLSELSRRLHRHKNYVWRFAHPDRVAPSSGKRYGNAKIRLDDLLWWSDAIGCTLADLDPSRGEATMGELEDMVRRMQWPDELSAVAVDVLRRLDESARRSGTQREYRAELTREA